MDRKIRKDRIRLKANLAVKNFLLEHSCVDCQETDIRVLQFDHVRGMKKNSISRLIRECYSIKSIFKEIEKCEIRCANCHIKKTAKDFDWNKDLTYCDYTDSIKIKDELNQETWKYR